MIGIAAIVMIHKDSLEVIGEEVIENVRIVNLKWFLSFIIIRDKIY